ncbi:glutaredoxin-3 [Clonorchis sinensis]|uniref:Glutaredoxin-3 n=1 Tax=Clonorchis sinensis TaxID=79923 RepID=G7YRB7_CLOSI|nr:glutaredoxin-3 [Clonorchis sinensis]
MEPCALESKAMQRAATSGCSFHPTTADPRIPTTAMLVEGQALRGRSVQRERKPPNNKNKPDPGSLGEASIWCINSFLYPSHQHASVFLHGSAACSFGRREVNATLFSNVRDRLLLVVNFSADWAPQCTHVADVLKVLASEQENSMIEFVEVNAESVADVSKELKVDSVPTVILFKNGTEVHRICGANIAEITKAVSNLSHPDTNGDVESDLLDLNTRLRNLIRRSPVMLFMKGTPSQPRCGFSKQILEILNSLNVSFDTFDILTNEEVRQGLKTFSNWPTYPQLYVKGELIGGLDIVKEMAASGELEEALKV